MPISNGELNHVKEAEKRSEAEKTRAKQKEKEDAQTIQDLFENEVLNVLRHTEGEKHWFTPEEIAVKVIPNKFGYYTGKADELYLRLMNTLITLKTKGKIETQVVGVEQYHSAV